MTIQKQNIFSIELEILAIISAIFCIVFQITSWYDGGSILADILSLICFILALTFAWQYREEKRRKLEKKLKETDRNRIYDVNKIVKRDILSEMTKDIQK